MWNKLLLRAFLATYFLVIQAEIFPNQNANSEKGKPFITFYLMFTDNLIF